MDWQNPTALYLILPLCIGWLVLALYSQSRRVRARQLFVANQMSDRILPEPSAVRFWIKLALREVAIVAGLVALAGPRFGEQYEQIIPRGSDLYVLIDVSRSMLAEDVAPTRLGRAKADVSSLVNRLEGERIGLIAFAGQAVVKCPLTVDYNSFRRALNELDPNSAPRGGTAIGDAIRKSLEVFQSNSERDQAILLITDGDDQQSYPLEAATVAAERQVTIFSVGLGDAEKGSRIPQKDKSGLFVEHQGEQVWSKLDGTLLQEIALKTSGVYIPAGTRSYDLGELYTKYLQGRRGDDSTSQTRIRRTERFQIFLAIALLAILIDMFIIPFRSGWRPKSSMPLPKPIRSSASAVAQIGFGVVFGLVTGVPLQADDSVSKVREGLKFFADQKFDEAHDAFALAASQLEQQKSPKANVAIFDEACAFHRKGDFDKARDRYLQAGLSQDRNLATAAHFNLGMLSSEQARSTAGDQPESVAVEKRKEIIESLKQSVASYRHCLELDPKHTPSRKNIELVRQWIKFYTDKWNELDRQKRRNETNLLQFLDYIVQAQTAIQDSVEALVPNTSADTFAELKRIQDELAEEIPVLRDKIDSDLRPKQDAGQPQPQSPQPQAAAAPSSKELEEGIALLQSWADEAGKKMANASSQLARSNPTNAVAEQKAALEELDRIWDAIINFHALLAKELGDQTQITQSLGPATVEKTDGSDATTAIDDPISASSPSASPQQLAVEEPNWKDLQESQEKALRKARLLAPKAEAELSRMDAEPQPDAVQPDPDPQQPQDPQQPKKIDPEEVKAGYRKAIELAPSAVEQMESASEQIKKKDRNRASVHAEEARRILQEIQDAQPKNPEQDKQDQQDKKDNQDQQQNQDKNDEKKDNEDKKGQDEKDQQSDKDKQDPKKQDENKDKDKEGDKDKDKKEQEQQQPKPNQVSKDRIEDMLRKVREREQDKRERDRELRARILGRTPVDKDW